MAEAARAAVGPARDGAPASKPLSRGEGALGAWERGILLETIPKEILRDFGPRGKNPPGGARPGGTRLLNPEQSGEDRAQRKGLRGTWGPGGRGEQRGQTLLQAREAGSAGRLGRGGTTGG